MSRKVLGWVAGVVIAVGAGGLAWLWLAGGSGEASTELTTPDVEAGASTTAGPGDPDATTAFVIDGAESTASFEIDEELRGQPKHVVGETDQVAGQVVVDLDDLSTAAFSPIVINARTFRTDSERRDRAIRGPVILNSASDEHELITFEVTAVDGLAGKAAVGDSLDFRVTGDLTIRGTTNEATFDVTVTVVDTGRLEGTATATVLRSDFGIGIPSVVGVANVTDQVTLNLDFTAVAG